MITFTRAMLAMLPLVLMGTGAYMIYPPAALIIVGALLWFEVPRRK